MQVLLLEVNRSGELNYDENRKRMMEWLSFHYRSLRYELLKGKARDELYAYFIEKKNTIVVMGAYGRSLVSAFFKKSSAEPIISKIDLPIFITHH
jgi:hypothetical protein